MRTVVVACLFGIILLATASQVMAAACPVTVRYLGLNSIGSTNGVYQYAIVLTRADSAKQVANFSVTVRVVATNPKTMRAADVTVEDQADSSHLCCGWLFTWEPSDPPVITIAGIKNPDGALTPCDAPAVHVARGPAPQAVWHFDDSTVQLSQDLNPLQVSAIRVTDMVRPDFPLDRNTGQRPVFIALVIGPDGHLISSWVTQGSGSRTADQNALVAARQNSYQAPEVKGRPVAATFLIEYVFSNE
jgi:TonB family protein